jgi:hypothetical protein
MAYKIGVADDYLDMLAAVKRFACGYPLPDPPEFTGDGAGQLRRVDTFTASVAETWTITCTAASSAKATTTLGLINGDAESGDLTGWSQYDDRPQWTAATASPSPRSGTYYFRGGSPGGFDQVASSQTLDLLADGLSATDIDQQACVFNLNWWEDSLTAGESHFLVRFLDASEDLISEQNTEVLPTTSVWTQRSFRWTLPAGCRHVQLVMVGYLMSGSSLNAYLDDIVASVDSFPARFSLSGSTTGSLGSCSAHDGYQIFSHLSFQLTDPASNFQVGDQFTLVLAANSNPDVWEELDFSWRVLGKEPRAEFYVKGPGWSGNDEIYLGFREWRSAANQAYSWRMNGYTAYIPGESFHGHPGAITVSEPVFTSWDQPTAYWLLVSGGRIQLVNKMGSVYSHLYAGFLKAYYTPSQYPYPLVIGGSSFAGSGAESYTSVSAYHNAYWLATAEAGGPSALRLRSLEGAWKSGWTRKDATVFGLGYWTDAEVGVFPWYNANLAGLAPNLDGSYPLFPSAIHYDDGGTGGGSTSFHGELEGLCGIPGRSNSSENTATVGGDTYVVFQSTFNTDVNRFCAIKLE